MCLKAAVSTLKLNDDHVNYVNCARGLQLCSVTLETPVAAGDPGSIISPPVDRGQGGGSRSALPKIPFFLQISPKFLISDRCAPQGLVELGVELQARDRTPWHSSGFGHLAAPNPLML